MRRALPSGTVTLVFTDIEGSTRLLEELGNEGYRQALARHREVVRKACNRHQGYEVDYEGDAFFYAFSSSQEAVSAVSEAMRGLEAGPIRIRVGMHTGEPTLDPPKYVGLDVHRAARIMSAAHGGQVLLSKATRDLLAGEDFLDLGEHRLKDFADAVAIYQLGEERFPPLKTISNTNLPRPASSFVGREQELAEVLGKVAEGARLLTLTGPGGSGKTRLALEAAATLVPDYKAGVFWVGLAALRDPALVTETISQTLGAKDGLASHIGERELLLLLDNLEQVVEAAPELSKLLSSCPNLTLLCTSRELLRTSGEVEYPVPPLASAEAVSLFCERSGLEPSDEISELCSRLDDLPLAVELAAARTKALTPAQILERVSSRLDLLKGGRDADPRQQTLRATIAWSYDLLSEEEQRLFRALSVFSGGCTLEAAEEVTDADLDTLQSLAEKSLLRFTDGRYWMLETIREYAAERLEEAAEAEDEWQRFSRYVLAFAEEAEPALYGPEQGVWLARLESEHANLAAALVFLQRTNAATAVRVAAALRFFWVDHGHLTEGRRWLEWAVDAAEQGTLARVLYGLTSVAFRQGDYAAARAAGERHVNVARAIDDSKELRRALAQLGHVADAEGDIDEARQLYERSLGIGRSIGDLRGVAVSLAGLADIAVRSADEEHGSALAEEAVAIYRDLGDPVDLAATLCVAASAALARDRPEEAVGFVSEALTIFRRGDDVLGLIACAELLAAIAIARGHATVAARLLGTAEAMRIATGAALEPSELELHTRTLVSVEDALASQELTTAWAEGAALPPVEVLDAALANLD
jgi:predicted ATPase